MKGGVGKTTLAANVTRAIADRQKTKVLLIDADSQCNLTQLFVPADELDSPGRTIYDALSGHKEYKASELATIIPFHSKNGSEIHLLRGSFDTFQLAVNASSLKDKHTFATLYIIWSGAPRQNTILL